MSAKTEGAASSVNGGESLCLALATFYCNDPYQEAARLGMRLSGVEVEVVADFGGPGEPARRITYAAQVSSDARSRRSKTPVCRRRRRAARRADPS